MSYPVDKVKAPREGGAHTNNCETLKNLSVVDQKVIDVSLKRT